MKKNSSTTVRKTAPAVDGITVLPQRGSGSAAAATSPYVAVVGLDVGDRQSHYCVLDLEGSVVTEGVVKTTEASLRMLFEGKGRMRIALEAGTHSPWISRLLIALDHEVLVANPRKLRLIAESDAKHDRADAQVLERASRTWDQPSSPPFIRGRHLAHRTPRAKGAIDDEHHVRCGTA